MNESLPSPVACSSSNELPSGPPSEPPPELIDVEQLNEMRAIAGEGFDALVEQLHANVNQGVDSMRAAAANGNADELRRAAHRLKGSAATLGVRQVAALSYELESLGKSGSVLGAEATIDRLLAALAAAAPFLAANHGECSERAS